MRACNLLAKLGYSPLCPLLYFPRFLSTIHAPDVADAAVLKQHWLEMSEEVWVFGDERTEEMEQDIQMAKELELPIRYYPEPDELLLTGTLITGKELDVYGQYRYTDSSIFGKNFILFRNRFFEMGGYECHTPIFRESRRAEFLQKVHATA